MSMHGTCTESLIIKEYFENMGLAAVFTVGFCNSSSNMFVLDPDLKNHGKHFLTMCELCENVLSRPVYDHVQGHMIHRKASL